MINRILIRIKVLQIVYSFYQNGNNDLKVAENELLFSLRKSYDLYHYFLLLIIEVTNLQQRTLDAKKSKYMPTHAELNPNTRLVNNRFAAQVAENEALQKYVAEQVVSYIEDHYSEKISLDQIAENMYLSPFYISRIFKGETGYTPIRHLINLRLEKAKALLEGGYQGSIQEVAALVGYDDAYHFSKLFKKRYGVSPSQARKNT